MSTSLKLYSENRESMSASAMNALNKAVKTDSINYNVQLYSKILLENQIQSSTQHLRINEVNYESNTPSNGFYDTIFTSF